MIRFSFVGGAMLLGCVFLAYADEPPAVDLQSLQQQIQDLQKRVADLENKNQVISNPASNIDTTENNRVDGSIESDETNSAWHHLKIGMRYKEVKKLLGEPINKTRGSVEIWYYSEHKSDGPFTKFIFKRLNNWQAP